MDNENPIAPPEDETPDKTEPQDTRKPPLVQNPVPNPPPIEGDVKPGGGDPALKGYDPEDEVSPGLQNAIKRVDLPWQVVQLAESLPSDVVLVGYFMIGADHVLVTDKGFFGLHEGSLSPLRVHVVVDND